MGRSSAPGFLLFVLILSSCETVNATQRIVRIDADDLLRREAETLRLSAFVEGCLVNSQSARVAEPNPEVRWPTEYPVSPTDGDTSRQFQVRAELLGAGGTILGLKEVFFPRFIEGRQYFDIHFEEACRGIVCSAGLTCLDGACISSTVTPEQESLLPPDEVIVPRGCNADRCWEHPLPMGDRSLHACLYAEDAGFVSTTGRDILHFRDGALMPEDTGVEREMQGLHCWPDGRAIVGGGQQLSVYEDGEWNLIEGVESGIDGFISAIWGATPDDVWIAQSQPARLFHWVGGVFEVVMPPPPLDEGPLSAISTIIGTSADDVWFFGRAAREMTMVTPPHVPQGLFFDGSQLTLVPGPGMEPQGALMRGPGRPVVSALFSARIAERDPGSGAWSDSTLFGNAPSQCEGLARSDEISLCTVQGAVWRIGDGELEPTELPDHRGSEFHGSHAMPAASVFGGSSLIANDAGSVTYWPGDGPPVSLVTQHANRRLFEIDSHEGRTIAVGDVGTIMERGPHTWSARARLSDAALRGVDAGAPIPVAVGDEGTILESAMGTEWTIVDSPTTTNLNATDGGFAAGEDGVILQRVEDAWAEHPASGTIASTILSVHMSDAGEAWLGCENGEVHRLVGDESELVLTLANPILRLRSSADGLLVFAPGDFVEPIANAGQLCLFRGEGACERVQVLDRTYTDFAIDPANPDEPVFITGRGRSFRLAVEQSGAVLVAEENSRIYRLN